MKIFAIVSAFVVVGVTHGEARAEMPLACRPTVGKDAAIVLDGKPIGMMASNDPDHPGAIIAYPFDVGHVLMAWAAPGHYGRPDGSELYLLDCKTRKYTTYAKGDFGHSALLPDGKTLVFGDGDGRGIGLFTIATKQAKGLTYPPAFKPDGPECDGREPGLHDIVTRLDLDADLLEFERGGSCGFEGDWESTPYFIDHITTTPSKPRRGFPIATIASGAGDVAWAARSACGASATVWSSADAGATWTKHAIPKAKGGVTAIIIDATQPDRVAVATGACDPSPGGGPRVPAPDRVHVTHDGGATWQVAMLPARLAQEFTNPSTLASTDGMIEHLAFWQHDEDHNDAMWTSTDAGAHWQRAKTLKPAPTARQQVARVRDVNLEASNDGVVVRRAKGPTIRVYPYRAN